MEEYLETVIHQAMYVTINKLCTPLLSILTKLAKYDVGDGFLHTIKMLVSSTQCAVFNYQSPEVTSFSAAICMK